MEKQGPAEPPPAYGDGSNMYPPAGAVPQGQMPQPQPVVTTVIVTPTQLPATPIPMQCPNCHAQITTEILPVNGLLVWLCVLGLVLIGCWLGCCLIPLCIDDLKDVEHRCPQCRAFIGVKKRL